MTPLTKAAIEHRDEIIKALKMEPRCHVRFSDGFDSGYEFARKGMLSEFNEAVEVCAKKLISAMSNGDAE